jgi:hypothetical protein
MMGAGRGELHVSLHPSLDNFLDDISRKQGEQFALPV